ncbi:transposable element Tc1 transposase [Calocera cornea HHB12733]|uniref:Transposable element Tc1 transposase n=1 Tax=Calocera cornea HHB12733 TaxID=1353952 RepID=A0A165JVC6_9BASI|nr:transposable element Tc1 transposase [Calocera cornea HHB12733]
MNPIENAWNELNRRLRNRTLLPTNKGHLWEMLQEEWANLSIDYIHKLYDSIPRRIVALQDAKGL